MVNLKQFHYPVFLAHLQRKNFKKLLWFLLCLFLLSRVTTVWSGGSILINVSAGECQWNLST